MSINSAANVSENAIHKNSLSILINYQKSKIIVDFSFHPKSKVIPF